MLSGIALGAGPPVDVGRLEHVSDSPATSGAKASAAAGGAFTPWPRVGPMQGWYPDQRLLAVSRLADQVNEAKWELHFFDEPASVIVKAIILAALADKPHALSVRG